MTFIPSSLFLGLALQWQNQHLDKCVPNRYLSEFQSFVFKKWLVCL